MKLGIIFVVAMLQVVTSQGPPPQCAGLPTLAVKIHGCCKIPKLFKDEDSKECGFMMMEHKEPPKGLPPGSANRVFTIYECIMKKNNLLKDDGSIDLDAVNEFMNNMVKDYPEFEDAVAVAKNECTSGKTLLGPSQIYEPDRLLNCVLHVIIENCPTWDPSEDCTSLKNLLDECKPFSKNHQ